MRQFKGKNRKYRSKVEQVTLCNACCTRALRSVFIDRTTNSPKKTRGVVRNFPSSLCAGFEAKEIPRLRVEVTRGHGWHETNTHTLLRPPIER